MHCGFEICEKYVKVRFLLRPITEFTLLNFQLNFCQIHWWMRTVNVQYTITTKTQTIFLNIAKYWVLIITSSNHRIIINFYAYFGLRLIVLLVWQLHDMPYRQCIHYIWFCYIHHKYIIIYTLRWWQINTTNFSSVQSTNNWFYSIGIWLQILANVVLIRQSTVIWQFWDIWRALVVIWITTCAKIIFSKCCICAIIVIIIVNTDWNLIKNINL